MAQHFELGSRLRDKVTGVEGVAIARIEFLNGCVQYAIKPKVQPDGKVLDAEYVDSQQIELVDEGINKEVEKTHTGGHMADVPKI